MRRAAWVLLAPTAALAALLPPAVVQGGQADDPVRRQAEELAEEASKKFGEVLKGEKAEPGPRREAVEPVPERSLGLLFYWLDYSEQQYRGIMRRLAAESAGRGWDPATVGWLRRSNQEFQSIIEKLARAGGHGRPSDPVADAARRQKQAQSEPAAPPAAATPSRETAAGGGISSEQPPGGQAQKPDASQAPEVSSAPAATPPAEAEARQEADRRQAQAREAEAAPPAASSPDSSEAPAPANKLEIARGEEAAAARRRPADGEEEEEAPARPRQAPTTAVDPGAPEEVAAAPKREDPPELAPAAKPPAPPPPEPSGDGQASKAAQAHSDTQAAAPSPALMPQRLQSGVAGSTASEAAGGSGFEGCELAGVEAELPGWYVVKKGDTLWAIAKRHYGAGSRYRGIYEANRRQLKKGPDWILPCQRLYLPPQPRRGPQRP